MSSTQSKRTASTGFYGCPSVFPPWLSSWLLFARRVRMMVKLKELRAKSKLSIKALSDLCGVPRRTLEDIEARGDCRISTAYIICKALKCSLDEFYSESWAGTSRLFREVFPFANPIVSTAFTSWYVALPALFFRPYTFLRQPRQFLKTGFPEQSAFPGIFCR